MSLTKKSFKLIVDWLSQWHIKQIYEYKSLTKKSFDVNKLYVVSFNKNLDILFNKKDFQSKINNIIKYQYSNFYKFKLLIQEK